MSVFITEIESLIANESFSDDETLPEGYTYDFAADSCISQSDREDWVTKDTEPPPPPATKEEAMYFLAVYFRDRQMDCGGPIPASELLSARNIDIVLRLELSDCFDIFHACLESVLLGLRRSQRVAVKNWRVRIAAAKKKWELVPHVEGAKMPDPLKMNERKLYNWLRYKMKVRHTNLLFKLQREAYELAIPRHHSGGLLLVWLRLCMGFDV